MPNNDSIGVLRFKLKLLEVVIKEAKAKGDERWKNVVPQQRELTTLLVRRIREERKAKGEPEPKPTVVGMQPARLKARRLVKEMGDPKCSS